MDLSPLSTDATVPQKPVCVITGSSVAAGWNAEKHFGWAQQLAEHLTLQGWDVSNVAKPGADARQTIDRFFEHVQPKSPTLVIIGLGLWNERINQRGRKSVISLLAGYLELVTLCRSINAHVILGGVYPNQRYTKKEYELLKEAHSALQSWEKKFGVKAFDFLKNVDDGTGKWKDGMMADFIHPNDKGHKQLFDNIDLSIFDGLKVRPLAKSKL